MGQDPDGHTAQWLEPFGEQAQYDALSGARVPGDKREAAFAHLILYKAPDEILDLGQAAEPS